MRFQLLLVALVIGLATASTTIRQEFENFKIKFGKKYATPQEEEQRFKIFQVRLWDISPQKNQKFCFKVQKIQNFVSRFKKYVNSKMS
jgi:hypothetical protein